MFTDYLDQIKVMLQEWNICKFSNDTLVSCIYRRKLFLKLVEDNKKGFEVQAQISQFQILQKQDGKYIMQTAIVVIIKNILNKLGIKEIVEIDITDREYDKFTDSCDVIREDIYKLK